MESQTNITTRDTDKLTYFCSKSGYSEQINQTIDAQSGALSSISGQSNSLCVAPVHGLELTCQYLLDCYGKDKASKFAEIVAATVLSGDISLASSIVAGDFVASHDQYGRNRP